MIPAQAATQKTRRAAICRSYSGFLARRCRMTNAIAAATAIAARPSARVPLFECCAWPAGQGGRVGLLIAGGDLARYRTSAAMVETPGH
jgi:hypothetical protein